MRGGVNYLGIGVPRTLTDPTAIFIPRFGFAYSLGNKTVIRGGYGSYVQELVAHGNGISNRDGFSRTTNSVVTIDEGTTWLLGNPRSGVSPLVNPFPLRSDGTRFDLPVGSRLGKGARLGSSFSYINPRYRPDRQHRFRLDLQREVTPGTVVMIGYTRTFINDMSITRNLNYVPERYYSSSNVRNDAVYNELNRNVDNPFYIANFAALQASAPDLYRTIAGRSIFSSNRIRKYYLLRPFPHMEAINIEDSDLKGKHSHHGMQLRFEKRFRRGWTLDANYEWSHTRNKNFLANEFDTELQWVESDDYRPHRWTMSGIYELPFGAGRQFLNRRGLWNAVLGGWQLSALWQMQSGECIDFGNLFYYGNNLRGLALPGDLRRPERWFDNGWDYPTGDPRNANVKNRLFETAAGRTPAYNRRTFPFRMNWLRTDAPRVLDANLQKSFSFGEDGSRKVVFRVDFLNLPNHQFLGGPNTDPTSANFGRVTSTLNYPRTIQFILRVAF